MTKKKKVLVLVENRKTGKFTFLSITTTVENLEKQLGPDWKVTEL